MAMPPVTVPIVRGEQLTEAPEFPGLWSAAADPYTVKVSGPDFQLPAVVLEHLDLPAAEPEQIADAVEAYLVANPPSADGPLLAAHILAPEPHPAYDDIPSFTLLFENGLA
ncbi:hypothetical protein C3B60_16130 [Cryobacterium zongtaii]|nr:hypothetical protein C3B60_16130 [Cryobacterium zongtaii]